MNTKQIIEVIASGARPVQEDACLSDQKRNIFVVSDGFGGGKSGLECAKLACEGVQKFLHKEAGDPEATLPFVLKSYYSLAGNILFNSILYANRLLLARNQGRGANDKGGASLLAATLDENLLALANVGTTGALLLRDQKSVELLVPRDFKSLMDPFDQGDAKGASIPLTSLGTSKDLEPEIFEYSLRAGDLVVLYTDGLSNEFKREMKSLWTQGTTCSELSRWLKSRSFRDNAAIMILEF